MAARGEKHAPPVGAPAVQHLVVDENHHGQRLDNFLLRELKGVPKSHVYRIVRSGEVRVNKGRTAVDYRLNAGDLVRVPPVRMDIKPANPSTGAESGGKTTRKAHQSLSVAYEDEALLAIDKPAGLAVHGGSGIALGMIEMLRDLRPDARFLELVHRLDRDTSGLVLVAKKRSALTGLHALLRGEREARMDKHYLALVKGDWPYERRHIRIRLAKHVMASGERRVTADEEDGQESHTIVTRKERLPGATLVDCEIRTGRTHQIRVHLASEGYPILGDDKYGDFALNKFVAANRNGGLKRMFLHAASLAFPHPLTGEVLRLAVPVPRDLARYLDVLRGQAA
ncbi:MAG: RluA family pseudouridine synthase [Betaproteobacteria bacterium]|nr:RluA family pseudouridine synthase [Betaproteobacteria bacterium]